MKIHEKLKPGRACMPAPFRPGKLRTHSPRIHTFLCVVKRLVPTKNTQAAAPDLHHVGGEVTNKRG